MLVLGHALAVQARNSKGTSGRDRIKGTSRSDRIDGGRGSDRLDGRAGGDALIVVYPQDGVSSRAVVDRG